jgi:hypothetical protein
MKINFNNILSIAILILAVIIILQRINSSPDIVEKSTIVRDTVWQKKNSVIYTSPKVVQTIPVKIVSEKYLPDPNYDKLVLQYQELVKLHLAKNVQKDSVQIDSIGFVKVTDTVQNNIVQNRKWEYNIKYPIIKETIIQPPKKVNQLYIGGGLQGNQYNIINSVNGGILYKNKKDQIYGLSVGINTNGQIVYGVSSYWKIKFK